MIGRSGEYAKMFYLEGKLWWYRHLHEQVVFCLQECFNHRRSISILDAGCGTGGLLSFLHERGYNNLRGVDGSADAVAFCQERNLHVTLLNLNELADFEPEILYDAIICNDVFCYFAQEDLTALLNELANRLKPEGVLISNNNAFRIFSGQHDLAVGVSRRFVLADFKELAAQAGLYIQYATYWSFILSPLILVMRQWQRLQLKLGWRKPEEARSDVYFPGVWINEALYQIARAERKLLPRTPFGSSLFIIVGQSLK